MKNLKYRIADVFVGYRHLWQSSLHFSQLFGSYHSIWVELRRKLTRQQMCTLNLRYFRQAIWQGMTGSYEYDLNMAPPADAGAVTWRMQIIAVGINQPGFM